MASPYLDPKILARIGRLDLKAKAIVEGFISGMHRSPYRGQSVEFAEHRGYVPGDDTRHLDWRVYAKTGRYYVKQYEEETNLVAHILVDASESMAYGSQSAVCGPAKLEYAKLAAASLSYLILTQSDAVALGLFDDQIRSFAGRSSRRLHLAHLCSLMEARSPGGTSNIGRTLRDLAAILRRRGVVVVISDLFDDEAQVMGALQRLRLGRHEVIVFHLLDDFELKFPFEGMVEFRGLEAGGRVLCHPRQLKKQYLEEIGGFLRRVRATCLRFGIDYVQVNTRTPVEVMLTAYLAGRARLRKAGGAAR